MFKMSIIFFLYLFFINLSANAANIRIVPAGGDPNNGFIMSGSLVPSDLIFSSVNQRWANLHAIYETTNGLYWESLDHGPGCPANRQEAVKYLNKKLSGIFLNKVQNYAPVKPYRLNIYCIVGTNGANKGSWEISPQISIPPVPPDSPTCNTNIDSTVNFGTISIGETAKISTNGKISCDKDAAVNISLLNRGNSSAKDGVLKLDDATVLFGIDGGSTNKKFKILQNLNENFTLNFTLTDTGTKVANKTGALILKVEVL